MPYIAVCFANFCSVPILVLRTCARLTRTIGGKGSIFFAFHKGFAVKRRKREFREFKEVKEFREIKELKNH